MRCVRGLPLAAATGLACVLLERPPLTRVVAFAAADRTSELRIAKDDELGLSVDATQKAYEVKVFGLGETLTRISHDGRVTPWLAESVRNVDPLTWRVTLRKNAKFWDGTPVTAEAVAASFQRNWEVHRDVDPLISKETQIRVVDGVTLDFQTPKRIGGFPNQLAYPQFVVHKNGTVMTGPYRPVAYEPNRALTLERFGDHWMGIPPISNIVITEAVDPEARVRALLSGAVDMAIGLPPELLNRFPPTEYEISSIASKKLVFVQFNHRAMPFDDRNVREATSLALDRAALLKEAMGGHGAVATSLFPPYAGVDVVSIQSTDVTRAKQLLDDAGWRMGPDGVRRKEDRRLAFTLLTAYGPQQLRAWRPLTLAIQKQLRPLGFEVTVQEVPNIFNFIEKEQGQFGMAMRAINTLPTGDPYFLLRGMLAKGGRTNQGGYFNPEVETLLDDLYGEADPVRRQARSRQIQTIAGTDVPNIFLAFTPITIVTRRGKLQRFVPSPNNETLIDATFSTAEEEPSLRLINTISLPAWSGRFDHSAVDIEGQRLFIALRDSNTVGVIDLRRGRIAGTITGFAQPQGVFYVPSVRKLFVTSLDDGTCKIISGDSLEVVGTIKLSFGANVIAYDGTRYLYIGHGGRQTGDAEGVERDPGQIAIVDAASGRQVGNIEMDDQLRPGAIAIETAGKRLFTTKALGGQVVVGDRERRSVISKWAVPQAERSGALALDEVRKRLFVGTRNPELVVVFDTESGGVTTSFPTVEGIDRLSYDAERRILYATGSPKMEEREGSLEAYRQLDADHYERVARLPIGVNGGKSLLVPANGRLYVALPRAKARNAELRVYGGRP